MMRFLMAMFCAGVGCLLAGCWTVYETPAVALDRSQKFDLNLRLEGFTLTTLQQTGFSSSTANATAYDWQTNTTVTAHGNSTTAHYEYRPDESFSYLVTDVFETLGFNIRSDSPELVLAGRIGDGRFDWSDPWLYLRDGMAALISFPTFMMIGSYERLNDARILIYDINGKRIADYYSEKNCYVSQFQKYWLSRVNHLFFRASKPFRRTNPDFFTKNGKKSDFGSFFSSPVNAGCSRYPCVYVSVIRAYQLIN